MKAAGIGIWEMDINSKTVYWDERCSQLFGLENQTVLNYDEALSYVHPEDAEEVHRKVEAALAGEDGGKYDATYRTMGGKDGKLRWVNFVGAAYFDESGKATRFGGVAQDLSDTYFQQQKHIQFQQQITSLLDQSSVAIAIIGSEDLTITAANNFYAEMVGRKAEDIIGKSLREVFDEQDVSMYETLLHGVLETGKPYLANEARIETVTEGIKNTFFVNFAYQPLYDEHNILSSVLLVATDVTPQVIANTAVMESEQTLRFALDAGGLGSWELDLTNFTLNASKHCKANFGRSVDQPFTYQDLVESIHPDDRERQAKAVQTALQEGTDYDIEYRVNWPDGSMHWLHISGRLHNDKEGKPVRMVGVSIDITERIEANQKIEDIVEERTTQLAASNAALKQSNLELLRSNTHLEEFAHAASHDMKEPVRKIHFFTNQLKNRLSAKLDTIDLDSLVRIENSTQRMAALIDDLLLYSHVSDLPLEKDQVDLNQRIEMVLEDLDLDIQESGASIEVDKLPVVEGYGRQLQQLMQNLISNSIKYAKAGVSPHILIKSKPEQKPGYHCIEVCDNGIGFEQEYSERIFKMFARLHGKQEYSGTGVGLSIVKKVVENHNGQIEAVSELGKGSIFRIFLPLTVR